MGGKLSREKAKHQYLNPKVSIFKLDTCGGSKGHKFLVTYVMRFIVQDDCVLTKRATLWCSFIHSPSPYRVIYQPWRVVSTKRTRTMKRKATGSVTDPKTKRKREPEKDYCDVVPRKDKYGTAIWPASKQSIDRARAFLKEWQGSRQMPWNTLIDSTTVLLPRARPLSSRTRTQMALMPASSSIRPSLHWACLQI